VTKVWKETVNKSKYLILQSAVCKCTVGGVQSHSSTVCGKRVGMDYKGKHGVGEVGLCRLFMQRKLIVCGNKVGGELKIERVYSPLSLQC